MLRACRLDHKANWENFLPLIEFAYNNSHHSSLGMAPYKAFYNRKCKSLLRWYEVGERKMLGPEIVQRTTEQIKMIQEKLVTAQSR